MLLAMVAALTLGAGGKMYILENKAHVLQHFFVYY